MGRPPIGSPILVRLPDEMVRRVDALVGKYRRPSFIRQAVAEKLERDAPPNG